ncbi:alpha-L-fucosidase [Nocardioides sp. NPDC006273]|uniref:alpha-L-fucosidase n=1 Tax=Nocardioides sp. NPDC006273 TaxID=3155598 RepID=UPI0033B3AC53
MTVASWFPEAQLGIFVHWGIYSVDGIAESWSFYDGRVSYAAYMAQLDGFTASRFDADAWAELFERAGATYAVLTTKHHEGSRSTRPPQATSPWSAGPRRAGTSSPSSSRPYAACAWA